MNWNEIKYFKREEFDSPDEPGSGDRMNPELVKMLDELRKRAGIAVKVNSGYRTPAHNAKVGGKPTSAHLRGLAVDVAVENSVSRYFFLKILLDLGIKRIGLGTNFIHFDIDYDLPQKVCWLYGSDE